MVKSPSVNAEYKRDVSSIPESRRPPGGGHGSPLQYYSLENPMDGEPGWLQSMGVIKSWTQLKWLSMWINWNKQKLKRQAPLPPAPHLYPVPLENKTKQYNLLEPNRLLRSVPGRHALFLKAQQWPLLLWGERGGGEGPHQTQQKRSFSS